jgi:2-polyprenyl-3-methyl-5-hydroxy-6-metoxy-1,4-benzoquinol methylase
MAVETGARLRHFFEVRQKGEKPTDSNLTELNAAHAVDKGFFSHSDWVGHIARYGHVLKRLVTPKAANWSMLDVGCGQLQLPYFLWRNRCPQIRQYWGLDLRAEMCLIRMDITVDDPNGYEFDPTVEVGTDRMQLPVWPEPFDVVVCLETFEHVPRGLGSTLMARLFEWTRPGGTCIFSTPNAGVAKSTADNHHGSDGECREWEYNEKLELQRQAGFELEASYGVFGAITRLPPEAWTLDTLRIKDFHHNALAATVLFAGYPAEANNSLQILRRPK